MILFLSSSATKDNGRLGDRITHFQGAPASTSFARQTDTISTLLTILAMPLSPVTTFFTNLAVPSVLDVDQLPLPWTLTPGHVGHASRLGILSTG